MRSPFAAEITEVLHVRSRGANLLCVPLLSLTGRLLRRRHCRLDQTLFTRFVRLGVPHVLLDQQGRARPEIAAL